MSSAGTTHRTRGGVDPAVFPQSSASTLGAGFLVSVFKDIVLGLHLPTSLGEP